MKLMKGSQAKDSPFRYWTFRALRDLKRGDVLQCAAGATQNRSGAIDVSIAATFGSYDGAGGGAKEVDDDQDNDGDAHRDVSTAEGGPDVPFDAVTSFKIGMLPDGPPTYKEKLFIPPHAKRIRSRANSSQADKDRHRNELRKRASDTQDLKDRHDANNSARKTEHTNAALKTFRTACGMCPNVLWDEWCAESRSPIRPQPPPPPPRMPLQRP